MHNMLELANSPWDHVQTCERLAEGVFWVSTASHGGLMVDASTATETLSPEARRHGMKWGRFYCYEEDCQCSIPFFERPDWFAVFRRHTPTIPETTANLQTVKNWEWKYFEAHTGTVLERGESYCKDEVLFSQDHARDWVCVSATSGSSWEPVPAGMVKVTAAKGGRDKNGHYEATRDFLVTADEYKTRGPHGFVVDLSRHQEITKTAEPVPGPEPRASRLLYPIAMA